MSVTDIQITEDLAHDDHHDDHHEQSFISKHTYIETVKKACF